MSIDENLVSKKQLLLIDNHKNHLKRIYSHAKDYDIEYSEIKYDINFWIKLCKKIKPQKILELGVGTGRIAIPLAKEGFNVTGIDISVPMLARALDKKEEKRTLGKELLFTIKKPEDMVNFNLNEKDFDLIFIGLNTFFHLLPFERQQCFNSILCHLNNRGIFAIDVFNIEEKIRKGKFGIKDSDFNRVKTVNLNIGGNKFYERWDKDLFDQNNKILHCSRKTSKYSISMPMGIKKSPFEYEKKFNLYILYPKELEELLKEYFIIDYKLSLIKTNKENHFWVCRKDSL